MSVEHVHVLVEEQSMEEALRVLLPRITGDLSFEVYSFQCKDDLLAKLPDRLRAYRKWLPESWRVVVLVDRDDDDCRDLKRRLDRIAADSGLITRSASYDGDYSVVNRVAIEELEAWYFGDWKAVRAAYPKVPETTPLKAPYRNPDGILGGTWEAFERELKKAGYFRTGLRKIEAARAVAAHMSVEGNKSKSFQAFRNALTEMRPA